MENLALQNIYHDLLELSSIDLQKEYWFGRSQKYESSYGELMCRLFDDNNIKYFIDTLANDAGLSKECIMGLRVLIDMLNIYEEKSTEEEIINDPKWQQIVIQAKAVVELWDNKNS